jgi:chaperone modulatory protein CbpM
MPSKTPHTHDAELIDEAHEITLAELTRTCRVQDEFVMELIEEGVLEPLSPGGPQWRFASTSIVRIHKARRLQNDLGVNLAGIALALQLLDRIDTLEARLGRVVRLGPVDDAD